MKISSIFLHSKVARRIFVLFVLCALVPIGALAIISFSNVAKQLHDESWSQLRQSSKAQGMSLYERLELREAEIRILASNLRATPGAMSGAISSGFTEDLRERFEGMELVTADGRRELLFGAILDPPKLTAAEEQFLASGKTVISDTFSPNSIPHIFMSRPIDPRRPAGGILVAEIDPQSLWDMEKLGAQMNLCVLDQSNRMLFCSGKRPSLSPDTLWRMNYKTSGQFEWNAGGERYLADYWSVFLKPRYFTSRWVVVLSESKSDVLAPLVHFKQSFPLVILLALWVVLLASLVQIRRSLVPLERLREGTRRIANRDFDTRVTVTSRDEFHELALSFNTMAGRLGQQFKSLNTINEIDRDILSSRDTTEIIDTVLKRLRELLPYDGVSISLLDSGASSTALTHVATVDTEGANEVERVPLTPEGMRQLYDHPQSWTCDAGEKLPLFLGPLAKRGMRCFLVVPIFLDGELCAIISVGHPTPLELNLEDLLQARQVADQVAVALSNARLIEKLGQLSWGTLKALALAIDAKSGWTSGHSERVTSTAIKIGKAMGLPQKELEVLHRGGMLHDIGKIGTPAEILDKPGRLTDEEMQIMRDHVRTGARILEPIPGFAEFIPIVRQHHEWYNGAGYPDGLAGEAIHLHARIFAVADVYDALIADRPYRPGLPRKRVVEIIQQDAGKQFDPRVVEVFLRVLEEEEREAVEAPADAALVDAT